MCSHCAGDYEDPDVTAIPDEEEMEKQLLSNRVTASVVGDLLQLSIDVPIRYVVEQLAPSEQNYETAKLLGGLSTRQWEVLKGICQGLTNKELAAQLNVSERTVKYHVTVLLDKLNVRDRRHVIRCFAACLDSRMDFLGNSSNKNGPNNLDGAGLQPLAEKSMDGPVETMRGLRPIHHDRSHALASQAGPVAGAA